MSRIGNDSTYLDQESIQNINSCNYTLQNYYVNDCTMQKPITLATSQPCVFYNGVSSVGNGGCLVDENSKLTIGSEQTHPSSKLDLFQRPYLTIPFLGRGSVDPMLESQLQQGEQLTNKKTVSKMSEKSYTAYHATPLIGSLQSRVTNPSYCVENVASDGWVRGGVPSRELTRDKDYTMETIPP